MDKTMNQVDNKILVQAAYAMLRAYKRTSTLGDAVHEVANDEEFKQLPGGILRGMWLAIDTCMADE